MTRFALPRDLSFNTEKVADPSALAQERRAASWLYLNGEEFAAMEGGISYAQVQQPSPPQSTSSPIRRGSSTSSWRGSTWPLSTSSPAPPW